MLRRLLLSFVAPLAVALWASNVALAAEPKSNAIASVELTPQGPRSAIPLQEPFYVTGPAAKPESGGRPERVYAVFVRYWWGAWSLPPSGKAPRSCADVKAALDHDNAQNSALEAGSDKVSEIWPGGTSKHYQWLTSRGRVLVAPGTIDEQNNFAALANDPAFFHYAARYCVFVYQAEHETTAKVRDVFLTSFRAGLQTCARVDAGEPGAEARDVDDDEAEACEDKLVFKLVDALVETLAATVDEPARQALEDVVRLELAGAVVRAWNAAGQLIRVSEAWAQVTRPKIPALAGGPTSISLAGDDPNAGLAKIILEVLHRQGTVARVASGTPSGADVTYVLPSKFEVESIELTVDGEDMVTGVVLLGPQPTTGRSRRTAAQSPTVDQRPRHKLGLALAKLPYPEAGGLSIEDVRQFAAGAPPPGLAAVLGSAVSFRSDETLGFGIVGEQAKIDGYRAKIAAYDDLVDRVELARGDKAIDFIDAYLADWITGLCGQASVTCRDDALPQEAHVNDLLSALTELNSALVTLAASVEKLAVETGKYLPRRVDLSPELPMLSLTPRARFDQYISGFAGVGFSHYFNGEVAVLPVAGAHVFMWPSDLSEPMWSNGLDDFRRLVGLEYGVRLSSGSFGPDDRYRGVLEGSLPVMFVGLLLQPVPYVFVSAGTMLSSYRRSILAQERDQLRVNWYVGLTVDGNIAGWIRTLISGKGVASATPG